MAFRDFTPFFSVLTRENLVFFQIFLLRSIKAYLCPNIIDFDSVDFSERRPEEVMFLLTLGVDGKNTQDHTVAFLLHKYNSLLKGKLIFLNVFYCEICHSPIRE